MFQKKKKNRVESALYCDCLHKTGTQSSQSKLLHESRRGKGHSPLVEELLAVGGVKGGMDPSKLIMF